MTSSPALPCAAACPTVAAAAGSPSLLARCGGHFPPPRLFTPFFRLQAALECELRAVVGAPTRPTTAAYTVSTGGAQHDACCLFLRLCLSCPKKATLICFGCHLLHAPCSPARPRVWRSPLFLFVVVSCVPTLDRLFLAACIVHACVSLSACVAEAFLLLCFRQQPPGPVLIPLT